MTNLETVLNEYFIQVPIIQRDYAQGRKEKKVLEIRETFLEAIADRLITKRTLHLDFVYGSIKDKVFIPLDGQQRLTTLFLLYWYFGKKENKDIVFLNKFTYETRASSREFCQKLIRNDFNFSEKSLITNIKDSKWFLAFWENDPTIQSMLVMISTIHEKFHQNNFFNELNNITFEFFELEKFGLDDDLYIKMNARGKALTEFENFKAKFEQFLEIKDSDLKKEFEQKIDNEWTDFFWKYKDTNYLVDNAFMNYFYFISEMLYNRDNPNSKNLNEINFKTIEKIYDNNENIKFLFKTLDRLEIILNNFSSIFSSNYYEINKVALFDKDINFLDSVIRKGHTDKGFGVQKKIILFMVISYFITNDDINDEFKDLIRVVRNIIERKRTPQRRSLKYNPTFDYKDLYKTLKIFLGNLNKNIYTELLANNTDWTTREFSHEIEKAKLISTNIDFKNIIFELEDYKHLKGDIHNFLDEDISKMILYSNSIKEIFDNKDDTLIIRAMLTVGDCRFNKGGTRRINDRYFFGKNDYWEIFLTDLNFEKKILFKKFIETYNIHNKNLQEMIDNYTIQNKNWKYYFINYPEILNEDIDLSKDSNFFAWYNDFDIEKMGGLHLGAYHINPFIKIVSLFTKKEYGKYSKGEEKSYLAMDKYIDKMQSLDENWTITFSKRISHKVKEDLIRRFSLEENKSNHILKVQNEDRIILAINFIKYIESWQST